MIKEKILDKVIGLYQKKRGLNVSLVGDLGSGKTFFVREFVEKIYPVLKKEVTSPTFSYFHIYQNEEICIHHFDLYRIQTEDKLEDVGVWESLEDKNSLVLIEWANLFPSVLQVCDLELHFSFENSKPKVYLKK